MVRHHTYSTLGWARILKTSKLIIHSMHFNSNASFETSSLIPTEFGDLKSQNIDLHHKEAKTLEVQGSNPGESTTYEEF